LRGFRKDRSRRRKQEEKSFKKQGLAFLSSSGENRHYDKRCMERNPSGGVVPFCLKSLKRQLRQGTAKIIKKDSRSKTIKLASGRVVVVNKNLEKVITFLRDS